MTAIGMVLKSLGIEITDEHRKQIEALIPQVPARAVQVIQSVNAAVAQMNANTAAIEAARNDIAELRNDFATMVSMLKEYIENESNRSYSGGSIGTTEPFAGDSTGGVSGGTRYLNGNPAKRKRTATGD